MPYCPQCERKYKEGSYLCPTCNRTLVDVLAPRGEGVAGNAAFDLGAAQAFPQAEKKGAAAAQLDCVGVYYAEIEAQMAAGLLGSVGIPCLLKRATESPCYVYVRREDVRTAQKLLGSPPRDVELTEEEL